MAMPDGRIVNSMTSLKKAMMQDEEKIVKGIIGKLISYAIGREMTVGDRSYIDDVYDLITPHDHSLRAAIHAMVAHPEIRPEVAADLSIRRSSAESQNSRGSLVKSLHDHW